jgi:hypothetical protein
VFSIVIALIVASKAGETITFGASIWGSVTLALSVAALLIAFFSYVQWRVGRLVPERYSRIMANRARDAQRILRRWWLLSLTTSVLVAFGVGLGAYHITDPFLRDIRHERVITHSDMDAIQASTTAALNSILSRLSMIESKQNRAVEDVSKLKADLEQAMERLRAPSSSPAK